MRFADITKTILSVLSQKYKSFEYIILDGYSNDNTFKIIKKFNKNKKLEILRAKDKNLYDGINRAIKKTKGKYIGLIHSGDFFSSNKVAKDSDIYLNSLFINFSAKLNTSSSFIFEESII